MRTLLHLWEMSIAGARATAKIDGVRVVTGLADPDASPAQLRLEHNAAFIVRESPVSETITRNVPPKSIISLDYLGLVDPRLGLTTSDGEDTQIGRDLLGWGDFEDHLADQRDSHFAQWSVTEPTSYKQVIEGDDAPSGRAYLHLSRSGSSNKSVILRPVARTPIVAHRLFRTEGEVMTPADPEPAYSIRMTARLEGGGQPFVRLDLYQFDDTNPTEDPSSTVVGSSELMLYVVDDGEWHDVEVEVPGSLLMAQGIRANMLMFYVGLDPARADSTTLDVDQVELLEWRNAGNMPPGFGRYDYVRNRGKLARKLTLRALPAARR